MPTCPQCRHVHAGPQLGFICIGCPCPHTGTCDCSHCTTRAVLLDTEAMAAIEKDMLAILRGGVAKTKTLEDYRTFRQLRQGDWTPDEPPPTPGDDHAA